MQVHHLRDQSASDDADAQSRLSQAARDYTPTTDDRSIRRVPEDLRKPIAVAGAPVSFGAFEVTVGVDPYVPDAVSVLDAVQRDGYDGIDLGPLGYLGTKDDLHEHLRSRGLHLSGGYLPLPLTDPAGMEPAMAELRTLLDLFDTVKSPDDIPAPKPTLADAGSAARGATIRPSTITLARTSKRHGRSKSCWRAATSASAWIPATWCWAGATPFAPSATGARASTTFI
jgi:inosose dehydratase